MAYGMYDDVDMHTVRDPASTDRHGRQCGFQLQHCPDPAEHQGKSKPEPKPVVNSAPAVWDLVQKDFVDRDVEGFRKYGVRLQPYNGRDALTDAYQEALDLAVYLRQAIFERDGK